VALQYDEIGNPTVYIAGSRVFYMTWEGRLLKNATDSYNESYTFTYNADGLRTSKTYTYGSTTRVTNYYYSGSLLIGEETNGVMQTYLYDSSASPIGIQVNSGANESTYLFRKNLQGDIIGVYDQSGNSIFSYNYTAWGNFIKYGTTTTVTNPFTYRGYYYDADLGLYYLNSRYYDSTTGRFINEDGIMGVNADMHTYNLFVYCGNNPVNRYDVSGMFWDDLVSGILHGANNFAIAIGIDTAAVGAFFLMMEQDKNGVYHARFDCWQQYAGYNELYDVLFDLGTDMVNATFEFTYDGSGYTLWAWKGDYINLGAGAELGIYRGDKGHRTVDKSLAMWMGMIVTYQDQWIIHHFPSEDQWWITGFSPAYQNVKANDLLVTFGVQFNNTGMYYAFKEKWGTDPRCKFIDFDQFVILNF